MTSRGILVVSIRTIGVIAAAPAAGPTKLPGCTYRVLTSPSNGAVMFKYDSSCATAWRFSSGFDSAIQGVKEGMRLILMTRDAMIAGMVPMALAAEVTAPLGRAVISGTIAATVANLTALPFVFAVVQLQAATASVSLDPDDPESRYASHQ